ncbi:MAG: MBL fold metallo-hydrolase [Lachnospiraceae bacterium]|jgi:hydroxyacylglutathione hydrolase|nr:MBL fold metallo-hydrolase [Lachnospiraceae bacterium]
MKRIELEGMVLGMLGTNCYFIVNTETEEIVIVDPADEADVIKNWCLNHQKKPVAILLTHGHYDHILAAEAVREAFSVKIYAAETEKELLENASYNLSAMWSRPVTLRADEFVKDGERLHLAGTEIEVIATPGHTAGGVCYYIKEAGTLLSGDTLFAGSYGRTDFPTSSMAALARSVRERLFRLPEETAVYPGHGESTSIGYEKRYNPLSGGA